MIKNTISALALLLTGATGAGAASIAALTESSIADGVVPDDIGNLYDPIDPSEGVLLQSGLSIDAAVRSERLAGGTASPYYLLGESAEGLDYFYVSPSSDPSFATLSIADGVVDWLRFFWGSIDTYNHVDLYLGDTLVDTISGAEAQESGSGTDPVLWGYVDIFSEDPFDTVLFRSNNFAFEFGNLSVGRTDLAPVPVPASLPLLAFGLGGLAMLRRRANRKT